MSSPLAPWGLAGRVFGWWVRGWPVPGGAQGSGHLCPFSYPLPSSHPVINVFAGSFGWEGKVSVQLITARVGIRRAQRPGLTLIRGWS